MEKLHECSQMEACHNNGGNTELDLKLMKYSNGASDCSGNARQWLSGKLIRMFPGHCRRTWYRPTVVLSPSTILQGIFFHYLDVCRLLIRSSARFCVRKYMGHREYFGIALRYDRQLLDVSLFAVYFFFECLSGI